MKRTPIVLGGTLAGLIGVLTFHTTPARSGFTTLPSASGVTGTSATSGASAPATATTSKAASSKTAARASAKPTPASTSAKPTPASTSAKPTPASTSAKPTAASATRSATGPQVNYSYGILSVKVTVSGKKIVSVGIASLDDGGDQRSQYIDQQSIPMLEQETLQAQSANIQGVSGASYTSQGFQQSLQSALQSLGLQ
jgi:uncharacterized protein with FMN-binding domain